MTCELLGQQARELDRAWLSGVEHARPLVTRESVGSLDGGSAVRP